MQLELEHVWRTYQVGDEPVIALRDASVCIRSGELVSVVGPSGSGKSTIASLILGFYEPERGEVRSLGIEDAVHPPGSPVSAVKRTRCQALLR